jgi:hypothetical protein
MAFVDKVCVSLRLAQLSSSWSMPIFFFALVVSQALSCSENGSNPKWRVTVMLQAKYPGSLYALNEGQAKLPPSSNQLFLRDAKTTNIFVSPLNYSQHRLFCVGKKHKKSLSSSR